MSAPDNSRRILFIAMQSSIHVARWIDLIAWKKWDLNLFPINDYTPNPNLRAVNLHWPELVQRPPDAAPAPAASADVRGPSGDADQELTNRVARLGRLASQDLAEAWNVLKNHLGRGRKPAAFRPPPITKSPCYAFADELGETMGLDAVRLGESEATAPVLNGPHMLAGLIRRLQPDLIHSMEFQHAGYLVLRAREFYGAGFPPWLATNWGSDIFYFSRFADHQAQIKRLLAAIDFYSCECKRDIAIARQLGYRGPISAALPNSGGLDLGHVMALRSDDPPSKRKVLMIKGYEHFAGRAMIALKVLEKFASQLKGYRVVLFSPSDEPWKRALELRDSGVLNIEVLAATTHDKILARFGQARLYMGISISDAISTSVLEAMAMGTFPIQTNTSCCDEWFEDGKGGFIVPPDNFDLICDRFHRALTDDALVDHAAELNWRTVHARLDHLTLSTKAVAFYDKIFRRIQRQRRLRRLESKITAATGVRLTG